MPQTFFMCTCQGDITELIVSHFLWSFSSNVLKLIKLVMNFVAVLPDASNTHSVQEDWTYWTQREGMLSISLIYCSTSYFATIEKVATNTVVSKEAVSSKDFSSQVIEYLSFSFIPCVSSHKL